jgi:hypothetical protein
MSDITIHDELADALVEVISGLPGEVAGYKWSPGAIKRPCAVVELPTFRRTQPDQREDHVGFDDWRLTFPVAIYFELGLDPVAGQVALAQIVADWIRAIDAFPPELSSLCTDAKVIESTPFVEPTQAEATVLIGYETHVSILTFQ